MTSQKKCVCKEGECCRYCTAEEKHGLQASAAKQRIDAQATAVPPAVGEFAVHEIDRLSARLAKYEDAEGRPVVDAQRLLDWNRSQPEPRPIVVGREYQVAEACARLNSSPAILNQCDGCRAGIPAENGMHAMGIPGGYADKMMCTASRYESAPSHGEQVREVPEGEPDWPDYHHNGMGCGLEDRGITDRYEAMQHGWDDAFERCVIAFNDWIAAAPSAVSQEQGE